MSDQTSKTDDLSRRRFLAQSAAIAGAVALPVGTIIAASPSYAAKAQAKPVPETLIKQLYDSMTEKQRKTVCFSWDHPLRGAVNNNWYIVEQRIGEFYTKDQQALILQIFKGLHSPEYIDKVLKQVEQDSNEKDLYDCAIAIFGEPGKQTKDGKSQFEFVLTGRHITRRCDGNSNEGKAFGGPIFYGHAANGFNEKPDHPGNVYWFQAKRANEVFQALSEKQRKLSLRNDPRGERKTKTVQLTKDKSKLHGIPCSELSSDQKGLVKKVMADLLAPFRKADADESMKLIEAGGGIDALHMAFYNNKDIGNDGVWDNWQIESPNMVWYFRGAPHVHTWVNITAPTKKA
jgi:hypothetical protein